MGKISISALSAPTDLGIKSLDIKINGVTSLLYDGKKDMSINLTPSLLGAATSSHNHDTTYAKLSHTHTKSQITDFPTSMPASDVLAWAKAATKPSYIWDEINSKPTSFTPATHTHSKSQITDFPTSMPASDVPSWAKAASKPSYWWGDIMGNLFLELEFEMNSGFIDEGTRIFSFENLVFISLNFSSDFYNMNLNHILTVSEDSYLSWSIEEMYGSLAAQVRPVSPDQKSTTVAMPIKINGMNLDFLDYNLTNYSRVYFYGQMIWVGSRYGS